MSARAQTGAAPVVVVLRDPAALLALSGGCVLLVEALLAALLFGFDAEVHSPVQAALLLGVGGLVALIAARLVLIAPRAASVLCLVALTPAAAAHLPAFTSRLHAHYYYGPGSFTPADVPSLGAVLAPLLAWLVAAAPLVCAAFLAWHRSAHEREGVAG